MTKTFFFLSLFFAATVFAKDPCKYVKDYSDAFISKRGRIEPISQYTSIGVFKIDDNYKLIIKFAKSGDNLVIMPKGTVVKIALEDKTILELKTEQNANPKRDITASALVMTQWSTEYLLTNEQLKVLSNSSILAAMAEVAEFNLKIDFIWEKRRDAVKNASFCLYSELSKK